MNLRDDMLTLGLESTAHTIGVGIVRDGRVVANERALYKPPAGQGLLPRAMADHHAEKIGELLPAALKQARVSSLSEIDLFSFAQGPGIGQPLRVASTTARFLSSKYAKPLLGVNHCAAHLEIASGTLNVCDPLFLYVSGANTMLVVRNKFHYHVLGETLDIGVGNLFDVFAREKKLGLAWPHGSEVARLAASGKYFELPYTVKGMNLAFTGLQTSAVRALSSHSREDVCYSLTETAFAQLCEVTERALCLTNKKAVIACGGVAQNARLKQMLKQVCAGHDARFFAGPDEYNADNGAMIAYLAEKQFLAGKRMRLEDAVPRQDWRLDEE